MFVRNQARNHLLLLIFSLGLGFSQSAFADWTWCYNRTNETNQQIHFFENKSSADINNHCTGGDIVFPLSKTVSESFALRLMDSSMNQYGFPTRKGQPTLKLRHKGQDVFVGLWNEMGQSNFVVAIKIDFQKKSAQVFCSVDQHYAETLNAYVRGSKFIIQEVKPKTSDETKPEYNEVKCD